MRKARKLSNKLINSRKQQKVVLNYVNCKKGTNLKKLVNDTMKFKKSGGKPVRIKKTAEKHGQNEEKEPKIRYF